MWANIFVINKQILCNVETESMFPPIKRLKMLSRTIWGQQLRSPHSSLNCLPLPINALSKGIDSWLHSFCFYKTLINLLSSGTSWLETFPGPGSVIFVYRINCVLSFVRWDLWFFSVNTAVHNTTLYPNEYRNCLGLLSISVTKKMTKCTLRRMGFISAYSL